jgi:DNA-binding NtrC family response regulator
MADTSVNEAAAPARLLLIESSRDLGQRLAAAVAAEFVIAPVVVEIEAGRPAVELLKASAFDIVAADLDSLADLCGPADGRIGRLARAAGDALIVVLAADTSISATLAAMQAGAHECVNRDIGGEDLVERIGALSCRHGRLGPLTRGALNTQAGRPAGATQAASLPAMRDLVLPMWRQEQRIIEDAIQSFAGNIAMAAAALELSPSTIYRKRQAWAEMDGKPARA